MRVLMLGWEFPPFIAGGLGVACFGLTKAIDKLGHSVVFTLPKAVDRSHSSHVRLLSPASTVSQEVAARALAMQASGLNPVEAAAMAVGLGNAAQVAGAYRFAHAEFRSVDAAFSHPYPGFDAPAAASLTAAIGAQAAVDPLSSAAIDPAMPEAERTVVNASFAAVLPQIGGGSKAGPMYGSDLIGDAERYARLVVALSRGEQFDVIHAHDWLTYPAGLAVSRIARKPLVVHVHSTEFDRAGSNVNQAVYDIERAGMHGADRVLAVSQLTKTICESRYGVKPERIHVVHNGVDRENTQPDASTKIESGDKLVLFLGRITMQKGPEYFIAAAKRVLEKVPHTKFVLAGSGDMAERMIELAANLGIGHKVIFTGFLKGGDVQRVFDMADCYVMPSVSEPFGLAALEAIHHDVPVILSKQSGAAEVLTHVLKVDFWDIDEMANKIIAVLRHPPLSQTMREHGEFELRRLTWDGAAKKCVQAYEEAIAAHA